MHRKDLPASSPMCCQILAVIGNGEAYFNPKGSKLSWFESGAVLLVSTWLIPLVVSHLRGVGYD